MFPPMLSPDTFSPSGLASGSRLSESFKSDSDRARCQASNDSRTSAGESEVGVSCLLARSKSGRFNSLGEVRTVSTNIPNDRECQSQRAQGKRNSDLTGLTKDLPTLAQPSLIPRIDDKDDRVTFVIVFLPYLTDIALTTQVEEVQGGRGERDLSD